MCLASQKLLNKDNKNTTNKKPQQLNVGETTETFTSTNKNNDNIQNNSDEYNILKSQYDNYNNDYETNSEGRDIDNTLKTNINNLSIEKNDLNKVGKKIYKPRVTMASHE